MFQEINQVVHRVLAFLRRWVQLTATINVGPATVLFGISSETVAQKPFFEAGVVKTTAFVRFYGLGLVLDASYDRDYNFTEI